MSPISEQIYLEVEGTIASSLGFGKPNETIDPENAYSNKKEGDYWGNEDAWQ